MLDFTDFSSPILLRGDAVTAYRDPAVLYHNGSFHLFFTLVETEPDGGVFMYLAKTVSRDLKQFSPVRKLTPRNQALNFSSPGNIVRYDGRFCLCCQTYCRENGEKFGNGNSRIWLFRSDDLEHWDEPELLKVKGDDIPPEEMGRMIDPYLIQDDTGLWHCFFKQNGVSFSTSPDLVHWTFRGSVECGENVCVLRDGGVYRLWHSDEYNGIGEKISTDLLHWQETGRCITLAREEWPWAHGRLTAGVVVDLRQEPEVGKALLFFHGTGPEDERTIFDTYASLGFAWGEDLQNWHYVFAPGDIRTDSPEPKR